MLQIISVVQIIYLQAVNSSKTSECISSYPGDTISIKPPKIFKHVYSKFICLKSQHAITRAANNCISVSVPRVFRAPSQINWSSNNNNNKYTHL